MWDYILESKDAEQAFWVSVGYQLNDMVYCVKCDRMHVAQSQRNGCHE